jgi:ribosomal protein S1
MKKKNYTYFDYEESERDVLEKLYDRSLPQDVNEVHGKDLKNNTSTRVVISKFDTEKGIALGETQFGQSIVIDTKKEQKSLNKLGYPAIEMTEGQVLEVVVHKDPSGAFYGSVSAGYEKALKNELHNSIKDDNCAFKVKVTSVCNGGFMVDLSGIQCFLPGSLAAANRIMNFADYVGKELTVMVEIYDQKRDIFVVSFKKYLKKIIDNEVRNLSFSQKYDGIVTGASGNGVFIEWDEIFTGIIPFDESNSASLQNLKAGDNVSFFVVDIKNPQRVTLSIGEPNEKLKNIQQLKDSSSDVVGENTQLKIYKAEITKIKTFGAFVKLENGLNGLIEREKLMKSIKEYEVGQTVNCSVSNVDLSSFKIQLAEVE